jgi:acyl carrier protein
MTWQVFSMGTLFRWVLPSRRERHGMGQNEQEVRDTVVAIIRQLAPVPGEYDGTTDLHLADGLGFHSLALLELAFAIEDDFDLPPIEEETGRGITTTEQIITYVLGQLRAQGDLAAVGADA